MGVVSSDTSKNTKRRLVSWLLFRYRCSVQTVALNHKVTDALSISSLIGVLLVKGGKPVDEFLENVARSLQNRGLTVAGYLQREIPFRGNCCPDLYLESIVSAKRYGISQSLGPDSKGCRLDPRGLAEAAGVLLADVESGVDALILNRFGKGEADGQGFRSVIEAAACRNIPVLIAVRETYLEACRTFVGDFSVNLANNEEEIVNWCIRQRKPAGDVHVA